MFSGKCIKTTEQRKAAARKEITQNLQLISEIEKYDEIYDPSSKDFVDREAQDLAWQMVAIAMHESGKVCSSNIITSFA